MNSAPPPDLDAEREIDLARWRDAVVTRWYIVAAGLVAGLVLGALYSLSGGSVWKASLLLAPGQAFTEGGAPILAYQSSPRAINEIVTAEGALQRAAKKARMPVGELRGRVSTQSISTGLGATTARGSTLIRITVQNPKPRRAADAANALGAIVVTDTTGPYVQQSISALKKRIKRANARLESVEALITTREKVLEDTTLAPFDRLLLQTQIDNGLAREGNLTETIGDAQAQLTLAQTIQLAQIVSEAAAVKTTARSRRNSILVGGLIGLLVGAIAAVVADSRMRRPQPSS